MKNLELDTNEARGCLVEGHAFSCSEKPLRERERESERRDRAEEMRLSD